MKLSLNKEIIISDFNKYKKLGKEFSERGKYNQALNLLQYSSLLAWKFPFKNEFCDLEIENYLIDIGNKIIGDITFNGKNNKVVFYNTQIIDRGALTQQYLNYLIEKKYEILLVVINKKNITKANDILNTINNYSNIKLFIPQKKDLLSKIIEITKEIIAFSPNFAFIHTTPSDVVGFTLFAKLNNIKRYFIVHNDHTFWLGVKAADFFIEFRKFGYKISLYKRKISEKKIYINRYYPLIDNNTFLGFDFERKGKKIGFVGSNLYKILIDPNKRFIKLLTKLIEDNSNLIILIAGWGAEDEFKKYINIESDLDRIKFIGHRKDFNEVIKNVDIIFDSFPYGGGLTRMYSIINNIPLVGFAIKENYERQSIESFFDFSQKVTPTNENDYLKLVNKILTDNEFRENYLLQFNNSIPTKEVFNKKINLIIENDINNKIKSEDSFIFDWNNYLDDFIGLEINKKSYFYNKVMILSKSLNIFKRFKLFYEYLNSKDSKSYIKVMKTIIITILGKIK